MKKLVLVAALMVVVSAQAVEVGVNGGVDTANADRTSYGVTVGQKFDKFGITAGFDRVKSGNDLDKYTLVGSYDVTKFGTSTVAVKAGVAYLDNRQVGADGYAALVGAGVSIPVTAKLAATVDYRYQVGQSRVSYLNGSAVTAGFKYSF